jgi:hypothetical protein
VTIGLLPEELPRVMIHDEYPNFRWVRTAVVILKHVGIGGVWRGSRREMGVEIAVGYVVNPARRVVKSKK